MFLIFPLTTLTQFTCDRRAIRSKEEWLHPLQICQKPVSNASKKSSSTSSSPTSATHDWEERKPEWTRYFGSVLRIGNLLEKEIREETEMLGTMARDMQRHCMINITDRKVVLIRLELEYVQGTTKH